MKNRISTWLKTRQGLDQVGFDFLILSLIINFINLFLSWKILQILSLAFLIFVFFRSLSRKTPQASLQNQAYLRRKRKFKEKTWNRLFYKHYTCSVCQQVLRVPRFKGKIVIRCPRCSHSFEGRS